MIDILLNTTTGDVLFTNGDLSYGESTLQHQRDIIIARQGDYRYAPLVGVGIKDYEKDDDSEDLLRAISQQLSADGMSVERVSMDDKLLYINANY